MIISYVFNSLGTIISTYIYHLILPKNREIDSTVISILQMRTLRQREFKKISEAS